MDGERRERRPRAGFGAERRGSFLGEWWAGLAALAIAGVAVPSLLGALPGPAPEPAWNPVPSLRERLKAPRERVHAEQAALGDLCSDEDLARLGLLPDCTTGTVDLAEERFESPGSAQLSDETRAQLSEGIPILLDRLRHHPVLWNRLEAIEVRGHSDPRALQDPYITNLVNSQQRALSVLIHLFGPDGLQGRDRDDFERLASASGVSFSRPPDDCPERDRSCYARWRRVEMRLVLREPPVDEELGALVRDLDHLLERPVGPAGEPPSAARASDTRDTPDAVTP